VKEYIIFVVSDIHLKASDNKKVLKKLKDFEKKAKLIKRSKNKYSSLMLVPGDLAFSGRKEEYDLLSEIFLDLAEEHKMIFSPGNHDHDFSVYTGKAREVLLNSDIGDIDGGIINHVTDGQKRYFEFEDKLTSIVPSAKTHLSKRYDIDSVVSVRSLNTAWCSKINETGGEIIFPINEIVESNESSQVNISIMHHPLAWYEPNNQKQLRARLRESSDIIITGHEHVSDSFKVLADNFSNLLIENVSFDDDECDQNGFLVLVGEGEDVSIERWNWSGDEFELEEEKTQKEIIQSGIEKVCGFQVNSNFLNFLSDLGTGFTHPASDDLSLEDVFVYPNIRNLSKKRSTIARESSSKLLADESVENIILIGEECSGKTSLLKKLCKDSMEDGEVSVFLDGLKIKKAKSFSDKKLESVLKSSYQNLDLVKLQDADVRKTLFLDNFDEISGDIKSLSSFLRYCESHFDRIVVGVSDTYDLSENEMSRDGIFNEYYSRIQILKLGFRLRYELIDKWNSLKSSCLESKKALVIANDSSHNHINKIIGKNYIPSTPFFLLTMLQSMDYGVASDINTSSYGYYYQYLITSSLGTASVKKESLDEIFNYIKELSFFYYKSGKVSHGFDSLWTFNREFCDDYGLKVDCAARLRLLENARVLYCNDEIYTFKYPYVYYFFIAKYLSDNLSEEECVSIVDELIESLGKRKSMDILMFLTHHSKDKDVLNKIVIKSRKIFDGVTPADLDLNSKFLENVVDNIPMVNFRSVDSQEYRKSIEDLKDEREGEREAAEESFESDDEPMSNSDFFTEFNLSFKSLELLGQLSKNYYGSLKVGQKRILIQEAIEAPLRAIESIFEIMRDDPDNVLYLIENRLKDGVGDDEVTSSELRGFARQVLFNILFFISFNVIKKISNAVGSKNLIPVIEDITDGLDTNAANLINLSVKLDMGSHGSIEDLKRIKRSLEDSGISLTILRSMLVHYLYMFEVRDNDVRQICSAVGINYPKVSQKIGVENLKKFKAKSLSG